MADFHLSRAHGPSDRTDNQLAVRRRLHTVRRLGASFCLGLAVFSLLQILMGLMGHREILVAASDIARGDIITTSMVSTRTMTGSYDLPGSFSSPDQVLGQITRVSVTRDRPLLDVMVAGRHPEPPGTTSVSLHLSSSTDSLDPGDQVKLLAPHGCQPQEAVPSNLVVHPTSATGDSGSDGPCVLSQQALILNLPPKPKTSSTTGPDTSTPKQEARLVTMAMEPDDAVRVLSMDPDTPLVAVRLKNGDGIEGPGPTPSEDNKHHPEAMTPIMKTGIQTHVP